MFFTKKNITGIFLAACVIPALFAFSVKAYAQASPAAGSMNSLANFISIGTTPANPGANQNITVYVESDSTDLDAAAISWSVDGNVEASGVGKTNFAFTTGGTGSKNIVTAHIITSDGQIIDKTIQIAPAEVDLVWEADSYTPPFYRGKALYPPQGDLNIVALTGFVGPDGNAIPPGDLLFTWKKDYEVQSDSSGLGKDTLSIPGSIFTQPMFIQVAVSTADNSLQGEGEVTVSPQDPFVLFYEDDPLSGIKFEKALGEETTAPDEQAKIVAVPYFFNEADLQLGNLSFDWNMNGSPVGNGISNTATFRQTSSASGTSDISLQVVNQNKPLEQAANGFSIFMQNSGSQNLPQQ